MLELLGIAHEAVSLAADLIRTRVPGALTAKGERDMASELDFEVERSVRELLAKRTPEIGFLGEEFGSLGSGSELMWVLDPIDGTVNFVHGIPLVAVSLGLARGDRAILGVIDTPFLGTRYHAVEGKGAFRSPSVGSAGRLPGNRPGGEPITASGVEHLAEAVTAVGDYAVGPGSEAANRWRLAVTAALVPRVQRIRMLGTAAIDLVWLAEGRLDALVMFSNRPWDTCAGVVIAREAGARVVDRRGGEHSLASGETIAGSAALLSHLLPVIPDLH